MTCACDSFRVLRKVIEILVTPAITRNIHQFNCAVHGQEITFNGSCGMQGILVLFRFIFSAQRCMLGKLSFPECHAPESSPLLSAAIL